MRTSRYRRIVAEVLGSGTRSSGPRARSAGEVRVAAHRGPNDRRSATTYTGLSRPNRYY